MNRPTKVINIYVDSFPHDNKIVPRNDVYECIYNNVSEISTYDISFFCFDYLLQFDYNVIILSNDGILDLWEIYNNVPGYTDREIRPAHNVYKLYKSDAFTFKKYRNLNK